MKLETLLCLLLANNCMAKTDVCAISGCICDPRTLIVLCENLFFPEPPLLPAWAEELRFQHDHVPSLGPHSFRGSHFLKRLRFTNSDLEFLDPNAFAGLDSLEELDLGGNRLDHLPEEILRPLPKLRSFILDRNPIRNLSNILVQLQPQLRNLSLNGVPIGFSADSTLDIPLETLNLAETPIESLRDNVVLFNSQETHRSLSLPQLLFASLRGFDVGFSGAEISNSFLVHLRKLSSLNIAGTRLDSQDTLNLFREFPQLETFNASGLRIGGDEGVTTWDIFPATLRVLDISNTSTVFFQSEFVSETAVLREVVAARNRIRTLVLSKGCRNLERLDLSENQLGSLPLFNGSMPKLVSLDLSSNHISVLSRQSLDPFPNLKILRLRNNPLSQIYKGAFPVIGSFLSHLEELDLCGTKLKEMPSFTLPALKTLRLADNFFSSFTHDFFLGIPLLQRLELGNNPSLMNVELWDRCKATGSFLGDWDCYPGWISTLRSLSFLSCLSLDMTSLSVLPRTFFSSFQSLTQLNISRNLISTEVWEAWRLPPCLISLSLADNRLSHLSNISFASAPGTCLEDLDLSGNPWNCGCALYPLKQILQPDQTRASKFADLANEERYYCFSNEKKYPLAPVLASLRPCSVGGGLEILHSLGPIFVTVVLGLAFFASCYRLGLACGRKMGNNIRYFYRPLTTVPSQASSPTGSPCHV